MRVRVNGDGGLVSPGLNADPHFGELVLDDATGIALTTPSATLVAAAAVAAGESFGLTVTAGATSTLTVVRAGRYQLSAVLSDLTTSTGAVVTIAVQKNSAALSPVLQSIMTTAGTADGHIAITGIVSLAKGDVLRLVATTSAGNLTIKRLRFSAVQLSDASSGVTA